MTTLSAPSPRLLDRLARDGRWAESDRSLRTRLLETSNRTDAEERRDRDCTAHMLLHADDPRRVLEVGLDHLTHEFGAARADAALLDIDDDQYLPAVVVTDDAHEHDMVAATPLPNRHPILRTAWTGSSSLSFDRIRNNTALGTLEPVFTRLGMTSMIASRIQDRGVGLGLLCIDETEGNRMWSSGEHRRLDRFVQQRLAPVLDASLRRHASRRSQLTEAEGDAVRLLADGHSYSSIARELGKSARTIDNQLRSARTKAGVHTSIDLVRWWSELAGERAIADR